MSRLNRPMMVAIVALGVTSLMGISGQWSPRIVEKDPEGTVVRTVRGVPRPLMPEDSASELAALEATR